MPKPSNDTGSSQDQTQPSHKPPKTRSPNYPAIDLQKAIVKADAFYKKQGRHAAGLEVVAGFWDYGAKSSSFMVSLAALRYFGLLEDVKNGPHRSVKLSARALDIVVDYKPGDPEYDEAIKKAALTPTIHKVLWVKYGPSLPADEEMRRFLVKERGFNDKAVGEFISEYKATIAFAKLTEDDIIPPADEEAEGAHSSTQVNHAGFGPDLRRHERGEKEQSPPPDQRRRAAPMQVGIKEDVFNLDEGLVVVQYPDRLTKESLEDMEGHLEIIIRKLKRSIENEKTVSAKPMIDKRNSERQEEEPDENDLRD